MILGNRKAAAVFAAVAVVASGAMWAPATAQTPMQCVDVPGGTAGTSVKVGSVTVDVPAISHIRLCSGGTSAPTYRVAQTGGACTTSCLSVYVGGGMLDLGRVTVSWWETVGTTTTTKEEVVDPEGVGGPEETCVFSTGAPVPADPGCFVAVGVVPPPDELTPLVDVVEGAVAGAVTTVIGLGDAACGTVPDNYDEETSGNVDFCGDPAGWTTESATDTATMTCDSLPDRYDPETGQWYDACTNTQEWATSFAEETIGAPCSAIPDRSDPSTGEPIDFCDQPDRWGNAVVKEAEATTCAAIPDETDPDTGQPVDFCTESLRWATIAAGEAAALTCSAIPDWTDSSTGQTYDFCTDPIGWALAVGGDGLKITCQNIPDWYDSDSGEWVDFCTDAVRWTLEVEEYSYETTCGAFPRAYDSWGQSYGFCDDPVGWVNYWTAEGMRACDSTWPVYDPSTGEYVYPCSQPGRWIGLMLDQWCGTLCDVPPIQQLIRDIRVFIAEQEIKIIWARN